MKYESEQIYIDAIISTAKRMCAAAQTAPKGHGVDSMRRAGGGRRGDGGLGRISSGHVAYLVARGGLVLGRLPARRQGEYHDKREAKRDDALG